MFHLVSQSDVSQTTLLLMATSGRLTEPDDVANMCLYLGSDEGKFVTGINLEIDGGRAVGA